MSQFIKKDIYLLQVKTRKKIAIKRMQLKTWLLIIRIMNLGCAGMMIGFQIWLAVLLFVSELSIWEIMLSIWAPIFIIILALIIVSAEFKYQKIVEHFKFLQWLPGLAFFNLFIASIVAFQFANFDETAAIVLACLFTVLSIAFIVFHFLKPAGSEGLLSQQ